MIAEAVDATGVSTGPPGPRGGWFSGNLPAFERDRLAFLLTARDRYGPLVAFDRRTTIVNDPGLARRVLKSPAGHIREDFLQHRLNQTERDEAVVVRQLLRPSLRRSKASRMASIASLETERVLDRYVATGPFDAMPALEQITSASIASYYFSDDGGEVPTLATSLLVELSKVIGNQFALPARWNTPVRRRIDRAHADARAAVLRLLDRRASRCASRPAPDDLASEVVAASERAGVSRAQVADLLIGSLLAAHRVPAAAAAWTLFLLADHPEFRMQNAESVGLPPGCEPPGSTVTPALLESLRLYPPTWLLARYTASPIELGGYLFPPRHHFLISPYVVHRDPVAFEDPLTFRPERWNGDGDMPACYLPFGDGVRACPGRHLAVVMMSSIVSTTIRRWRVERSGVVVPDARTTLIPAGLRLELVDRESDSCRVGMGEGRSGGIALAR